VKKLAWYGLSCAILVTVLTAMPRPAAAQQRVADDDVTLNFVNADLQAVIKAVAEITGRNILIDPRVTGTVNIVAPKPVPRSMVFSILLSALRAQGFAAVGGDLGFLRIVPEAEAKFYSSGGDPARARGDQIVTEVFTLQHESAQQIVPVLRPLVSPNNIINAFPASNTLIVTDYAENLRRIRRVIASIDQPHPGELISIRLQHANAVDVAQTIQRLIPEAAQSGQPGQAGQQQRIAVTVDPRTNMLLVRADNPTLATRIRALATSVDLPNSGTGSIHVVYLKNADATKLAETLRSILSGQPSQARAGTTPTSTPLSAGPGGAPQGGSGQPPPLPGGLGGGAPASGAAGTAGAAQQGAMIQAYPETNSLVIIAPDNIYNSLRGVIDKLDARRAQVYVEALVVEVSAERAAEFGIQWQHLTSAGTSGTQVLGGTNFPAAPGILNVAANPGALATSGGLNIGVVRGTVNIPGVGQILNLGMLAKALENDGSSNILATPTLLTIDNEEARIIVGQNIPIITGSFAQPGGVGGVTNPFQTIDRRDVGLTLKVKPMVTQGGTVRLQIFQEVSSIDDRRTSAAGFVTNKRSIESQVLVDDSQVIVLGGLIQDDITSGESKVPILGDIPFIGNLFRYSNRTRKKTNLMVFLKPVVIRDQDQANSLTGDRYDYIRGLHNTTQPRSSWVLPDMPPRPMPALPASPPAAPAGTPVIDLRNRTDSAAPAQ
jgi:general secretion pathway protein D